MSAPIPGKSQFALIGVVFHPGHAVPWLVQDNRKALKNEYPCGTKADVLAKLAEILDDMQEPHREVTL
jgi:hypothetical protein